MQFSYPHLALYHNKFSNYFLKSKKNTNKKNWILKKTLRKKKVILY